jgi:hypothetical protein
MDRKVQMCIFQPNWNHIQNSFVAPNMNPKVDKGLDRKIWTFLTQTSWLSPSNFSWIHFVLDLKIDPIDTLNEFFDIVAKIASWTYLNII